MLKCATDNRVLHRFSQSSLNLFEDLAIAQSSRSALSDDFQDSPEVFTNAVGWLIRGIEDELALSHG